MSKNVNVTIIHGNNFNYVLNKSYDFIMSEVKKDENLLQRIEVESSKSSVNSIK